MGVGAGPARLRARRGGPGVLRGLPRGCARRRRARARIPAHLRRSPGRGRGLAAHGRGAPGPGHAATAARARHRAARAVPCLCHRAARGGRAVAARGRLHRARPWRRRRDRARQRARAGELRPARSRDRLCAAARGPLDPAGDQLRAGRDHLHDRPHRPFPRARPGRRVRCTALRTAVPAAVGRDRRCRADALDGRHRGRGCGRRRRAGALGRRTRWSTRCPARPIGSRSLPAPRGAMSSSRSRRGNGSARAGFPCHAHSPRRPMSRGSICSPTPIRQCRREHAWVSQGRGLARGAAVPAGPVAARRRRWRIRIGSRRRFGRDRPQSAWETSPCRAR